MCVTEDGGVDFVRLRTLLGDLVDNEKEGFGLRWRGRDASIRFANAASTGTLTPDRDKSVGFESTQNLIIEGDNLEVLKLLRKSLQGKVKLIYIDPPYNTGDDFPYRDDYKESIQSYLTATGQISLAGRHLSTNLELTGRLHSNWLSMMYPRLYLARSLLSPDGVIFVSINDIEAANLKLLMNQIFGESSFLGCVTWINKSKPVNVGRARRQIQQNCEYVLVYAASAGNQFQGFELERGEPREYPHTGLLGNCRFENIEKTNLGRMRRETMRFPILGHVPRENRRWQISQEEANRLLALQRIEIINGRPMKAVYPEDEDSEGERPFWSHLNEDIGTAETGKSELQELVGEVGFDTVKPLGLLETLIAHMPSDSVVLDFFAGSGTTAHAVMNLNARDGGSRRFIMVQYPEQFKEDSAGANAGFAHLAELTAERIRKAATSIHADDESSNVKPSKTSHDLGFRLLKLRDSNIGAWDAKKASETADSLLAELKENRLKPGRSDEDILFEVMVKYGVDLSSTIERVPLEKGFFWDVGNGQLVVVTSKGLAKDDFHALAKRKPKAVVVLDEAFEPESLKANARATFKDAKIELKTF
jgi:adenine-specific DNA-methyltransferase